MTAYAMEQSRLRLQRESAHFLSQVEKYSDLATPQRRRCWTRAVRCLNRRTADLAKLSLKLAR